MFEEEMKYWKKWILNMQMKYKMILKKYSFNINLKLINGVAYEEKL